MIFGEYEHYTINAHDLAVLPQVRKIKNVKIEELIDSIQDKGLINPIDVAKLTPSEFEAHINFINTLWKTKVKLSDFKLIDGHYYVVIAGHSRLMAIKEIGKRHKRACMVVAKIHKAKTSEEILAIQLDENIHSEPRLEERAIAIIETYRLGLETGRYKDRADFVAKTKHKFSRRVLSDAIDFSQSPIEVQKFIFNNNLPFAVGVELGRIYPLVEKYEAEWADGEKLEKHIRYRYDIIIGRMQNAKSIKRSLEILRGSVTEMTNHFRPKDELQMELDCWFENAAEMERQSHERQLTNERNRIIAELTGKKFEAWEEYLHLNSNLTGEDHTIERQASRSLYSQYVMKRIYKA